MIEIKTDLIGMDHFKNDPNDKLLHNIYKVTVINGKKRTSFKFYDSAHNTNMGIEPSRKDLIECIISDYNYTDYDFNEFCSEFGYDDDSIKAYKIYKDCIRQSRRLQKVISEQELRILEKELEQ